MYKYPFLDFNQLNNNLISTNTKSLDKLNTIYKLMGGEFWDADERIMKGSKVAIVGLGGIPFNIKNDEVFMMNSKIDINNLMEELKKTLGLSAFLSYLNPLNKSLEEIADKSLSFGHNSILHTISLNILIVGITIGAEHEFSSQRDIMHLSRLTVAKTNSQKKPSLTLYNKNLLESYEKVLRYTDCVLENIKEDNEARNLLYPSSKSSAIMLTGSLNNFKKLTSLMNSGGKEDEFVHILKQLDEIIKMFSE